VHKETAATIVDMDSPRSGFRRAAAASWALAGIGVAGVAGASALAYGDTVKPAPVEIPAVDTATTDPAVELPPAPPVVELPPVPPVVDPPPTPEVTPEPTVTQAPVETYTPKPTYTQKPTVQQQAPAAPTTKSQPSFPIRQSHAPLSGGGTSGGNSFSPHVTRSRGS
jgi:outer membrane biosynthesis protein TonB